MLQRPRVDVQVAYPGAPQPLRQRVEVRVALPAVHPGVPEPQRVPVPGLGSGGRVTGVVHSQDDAGGEEGEQQEQHQAERDPPGRPQARVTPDAHELPVRRGPVRARAGVLAGE